MSLLESVKTPADVKKLNIKELKTLCEEIRGVIVDAVRLNGGHLSPNLGTVELTVALYYVFDFPTDKLLFDVGHQSYTHKILSGRLDKFSSLRSEGGISGFPDPDESEADAFIAGHSGNSLSAGLGLCYARDKKGGKEFVVDVLGDASAFNGETLEALTATDVKPNGYIVVLNDNGMSISANDNGFYKHLLNSTTKKPYLALKGGLHKVFGESFIARFLSGIKNGIKRMFSPRAYIDYTGFKYVGALDGHNLKELIDTFKRVKRNGTPVLVHVKTVKGKGFEEAEKQPDTYHGVGKELLPSENTFSAVLGENLIGIAEDERVIALTPGMTYGAGLNPFREKFPDRFVDTGISEEHCVTLAAGMAKSGLKPYVCTYSTFLQRAYDQMIHDVCLQNLPVTFLIDRAGLVGNDG
ncbi:MAG: 1-deoxy-D-xylulose-5-phosphate synthase, partial [Clostridia bacterium]|nr:1-deoxy-D-xylulose-5-phosphate synthase [Clostridia bacterium]